jgi:diketogulonate reductase-like aldo/keto reductase
MAALDVKYIDLYMMHWPGTFDGTDGRTCRREAWSVMEQILAKGWAKSIGVSNFLERHLRDIIGHHNTIPHVNQIEYNPFQHPVALHNFCQENKIQGNYKRVCLKKILSSYN